MSTHQTGAYLISYGCFRGFVKNLGTLASRMGDEGIEHGEAAKSRIKIKFQRFYKKRNLFIKLFANRR